MKNLLILTYWSYKDALIQTYTLPYVRIIRKNVPPKSKIFLFTFEQPHLKMTSKEWQSEKEKLSSEGIYLIRFRYTKFGILTIFRIIFLIFRLFLLCLCKNINKIHAWCTPAGAIGFILSKLTGISLIIDSYEPHAESMVENGNWKREGYAFKILFYFEKKQSHLAKIFIATTAGMKDYAKQKYNFNPEAFYVKPACIDIENFSKDAELNDDLKKNLEINANIICIYAGKIGGIYLEKEIFDFFKVAYDFWGGDFKVILLTNTNPSVIHQYCRESNLPEKNVYIKFASPCEVSKYMSLADFAINPVKPVPTKRYCTSIKDGEYWAMGLPVVITPDISNDSEIISQHGIGSILKSINDEGYIKSVIEIDKLLKNNEKPVLKKKIRSIAEKYRNFKIAEDIYREIYAEKL